VSRVFFIAIVFKTCHTYPLCPLPQPHVYISILFFENLRDFFFICISLALLSRSRLAMSIRLHQKIASANCIVFARYGYVPLLRETHFVKEQGYNLDTIRVIFAFSNTHTHTLTHIYKPVDNTLNKSLTIYFVVAHV